ncbi:hypothetical protein [Methylocucumis oryzae]|uniref:Uncharacterized protein n=1 Tax=Methylocucumis oryzae TaxID=1632867 RepID=A0A0F3IIX0_9GAMM|nr:hypothetical protein [Methylocucumis oryzae]KJV06602.1 hypothetical protein VZ94_10115 [Methylocucumis oryzae]
MHKLIALLALLTMTRVTLAHEHADVDSFTHSLEHLVLLYPHGSSLFALILAALMSGLMLYYRRML